MNSNMNHEDKALLNKMRIKLRNTGELSIKIPNRQTMIRQIGELSSRSLLNKSTFNEKSRKKLTTPNYSITPYSTQKSENSVFRNAGKRLTAFDAHPDKISKLQIKETDLKVSEDCREIKKHKAEKPLLKHLTEKMYSLPKYFNKESKAILDFSYNEDMNFASKDSMEDKGCSVINFRGKANEAVFGLFDGHGGDEISKYLQSNMIKAYKNCLKKENNFEYSMRESFKNIDNEIINLGKQSVGSTGTLVHIIKDSYNKETIVSANIGDTRSYLFNLTHSKMLSFDHRVENIKEKMRIIEAGGAVYSNRVEGQLMLSRAFGDIEFKSKGVNAIPHITTTHIDLRDKNQFLIIACDGVWDVLTEANIRDIIKHHYFSTENIANEIIKLALYRGSWDNLSVFVIRLS